MSDRDACEVVWRQLGASLEMLRKAIGACPDELWSRPSERMGYGHLAYHTLFYVDHDLHPAGEAFASPPFDIFEYEMKGTPPPYEEIYPKEHVLAYLGACLAKARGVLRSIAGGASPDLRGGRRLSIGPLEVVLYELRHVHHHTGQLNAMLRANGVEPPRWTRRFEDALDA